MGSPIRKLAPALALVMVLLASRSAALAHQIDECVQAMVVTIEPALLRLDLHLTPGTEVADRVLALVNPKGLNGISVAEGLLYGDRLRKDLVVRLDGEIVEAFGVATAVVPNAEILRSGAGMIQIEFIATGTIPAGVHRLRVENHHLPEISAYLFNAARPESEAIRIVEQVRNKNQSIGEIEFTVQPAPPAKAGGLGAAPAGTSHLPRWAGFAGAAVGLMLLVPAALRRSRTH